MKELTYDEVQNIIQVNKKYLGIEMIDNLVYTLQLRETELQAATINANTWKIERDNLQRHVAEAEIELARLQGIIDKGVNARLQGIINKGVTGLRQLD